MTAPTRGWLLDHHAVETVRIDDSVDSYVRCTGMVLGRWGHHMLTGGRIAMLNDGWASKIELLEVEEITGRWAHIAYVVPNVEAAHRHLLGQGGTEESAPFRIAAARADCAMVRLPSGLCIQVIDYDLDSPDLLEAQREIITRRGWR